MENRSHALLAGFFTIALAILATLFALWLGRDKIQRNTYEIATRMAVAGLNQQAAVRYKGLKVGTVTAIDFDRQVPGQIVLTIEIMADTPVTSATYATLGYQGVTGIAYVQLDDDPQAGTALAASDANGERIVPRIPLRPGLMQNLEQHGLAILEQAEQLSRRLNVLFDPTNQKSLLNAVAQVSQAAEAWKAVPGQMAPTLAKLPALSDQAGQTLAGIRELSADAGALSRDLRQLAGHLQAPDGPLARLDRAAEQVSNGITDETLPRLHALAGDARASLRSVQRAGDNLAEQPQSILFGKTAPAPGPGEAGFSAPAQAAQAAH